MHILIDIEDLNSTITSETVVETTKVSLFFMHDTPLAWTYNITSKIRFKIYSNV